jgi:hypothetical protein
VSRKQHAGGLTPRSVLKQLKTVQTAIVPVAAKAIIPAKKKESLTQIFGLYMGLEAGANAEATRLAKKRDLQLFLDYLVDQTGSDDPDLWIPSITTRFINSRAQAPR